jgi:hypothetical protein
MRVIAFVAVLFAGLTLSPLAGAAALPEPRSASLDCDDSAGRAVIPADASGIPPFFVGAAGERRSHYSATARRYAAKIPAAIKGARQVTVRVPRHLLSRLRLIYAGSGLATAVTFIPCPARDATFFPGGLVFRRLEPISLRVEVWSTTRLLRLGRIEPRAPRRLFDWPASQ